MILGLEPAHRTNGVEMARLQRGLSREGLAESVGVAPDTVSHIEQGTYTPSVQLALRLSRRLEVPVERLFTLPADDAPRLERRRMRPLAKGQRRSLLLLNCIGCSMPLWMVILGKTKLAIEALACVLVCLGISTVILSRRVPGYGGIPLDEREEAVKLRTYRFVYPIFATLMLIATMIFGLGKKISIDGDTLFIPLMLLPQFIDSMIGAIRFWSSPGDDDRATPTPVVSGSIC